MADAAHLPAVDHTDPAAGPDAVQLATSRGDTRRTVRRSAKDIPGYRSGQSSVAAEYAASRRPLRAAEAVA
ncbi:hypothetical protein DMA12_33155 [Amycolatopsis balhimycina DSM 5908]|uniref:Uncharacterized protein n=1 Tax=Amycolatopsis balhimycina DSM 5908 TaxID=1081091 RepID=A0A428W603_AMYBA|nr:hypothetical protein [Amycolatopsis balhimycina]RSM38394.1 hypothetical protein DMA12_33155 [Amycolatopsis balhimycina DSM 5908]